MLRLARRTFPTNPIVSQLSVLCRPLFIYLFSSILVKIAGWIREEKNFMRFYHLRSSPSSPGCNEALWVIHARERFSEHILVDFMTLLIKECRPGLPVPGRRSKFPANFTFSSHRLVNNREESPKRNPQKPRAR